MRWSFRLRRIQAATVVGCLVVAGTAAAAPASVAETLSPSGPFRSALPATARVTLPPELVTLERKAEALHVNSVRFSAIYELSLGSFPGMKGFSLTLPIEGAGRMSLSPEEGIFRSGLFGQETEVRVIGHTTYVRRPPGSNVAKGRLWIREANAKGTTGVDPLTLGSRVAAATTKAAAVPAPAATFGGLVEVLEGAESVTQVGPEIVNGSEATEFAATLSPRKLLTGISNELLSHAKKLRKLTAQLYVFFSPEGLPVRTSWTIGAGPIRITASTDILATEVPVSVNAPPAGKTIGAVRLKKLEARMRRRQLRRLHTCFKAEGQHADKSGKGAAPGTSGAPGEGAAPGKRALKCLSQLGKIRGHGSSADRIQLAASAP